MESGLDPLRKIEETTGKENASIQEPHSLEQTQQLLHKLQAQLAELERQNAELRSSQAELEDKLRQSLDHSPPFISRTAEMSYQYQLFPDGRSCFPVASETIREIYEVAPEQVREDASPVFAVIHPDDYFGFVASLHDSARTLRPWEHEFRVTLQNQGVRWHYGTARPQNQMDGSVLWDGIIKDITAQKINAPERGRVYQTTENTNEILGDILENMSDWLWEVDFEGRYTYCSPHVETFLGYTPDELIGKTLFDVMPPEEAERVGIQFMEICSMRSHIKNLENWNICKDGRQILFITNGAPILDVDGNLKGYRGVDRDITEQKRIEAELRKLSRAVQQSPVSIVITDTRGLIEFVNPKFTDLTGYTAEEAIGQNPRILNAGQTPPETFENLWRTVTSGNTWKGEVLNKAKDGSLFWELTSVSPLYDENGVITHYLAVKEDITEKKHVTDQLIIAKEQAERATLAKSSFLATMSHEIRTPMNGVIGMTSLLLDTELNAEQLEYTEIVRKSAENLLTIINEILDFSKIEAGKLDLEILDFDVRLTVEETAELLAFRVADKGLELICCIDPEVPSYLRGDPGRLRQIIMNLVGNAIKFTHHGEIVINVSLSSDQDNVATLLFKIHDTGVGIPAERLGAIFTPYSQADVSTSREYGGTGLGLPICKQLAELMGGEIGVTSEMDLGSTFWFTGRFEKQSIQNSPAAKNATAEPHVEISGIKVLAITTSVTNRSLLTTLLNQWGCHSETAIDGESALLLLQQAAHRNEPFRLLLMDQRLPDMDGRELGRRIKDDPALESTSMVMLTVAGQRGDAAALTQIGFSGYLTKPVRPTQLHDCIALVLGKNNAETQNTESLRKPEGIITRHTVEELAEHHVRILLAEDNVINQKVMLSILSKLDYRTDVAADGLEAVRALERIDYDLVLMDVMMPGMDGFAATAEIRDMASQVLNHDVPIIAVTANALKNDRDACLAAGMNDFLPKPVRKDELAGILKKWLQRSDTMEPSVNTSCSQPSTPLFFDEVELLNTFEGDRDFAESILDDALQELPDDIITLNELAMGDDTQAIRHQAHTMKGLAANISAPALREICFQIEEAAANGSLESVRKLLPEMDRIIFMTVEAIRTRNKT